MSVASHYSIEHKAGSSDSWLCYERANTSAIPCYGPAVISDVTTTGKTTLVAKQLGARH